MKKTTIEKGRMPEDALKLRMKSEEDMLELVNFMAQMFPLQIVVDEENGAIGIAIDWVNGKKGGEA